MKSQHSFHCLTKHVGRGPKNSLKRVHILDNNDNIDKTLIQKEKIEQAIIQHNTNHYSQALDTPTHKDKIYNKLQEDRIRDAILDGTLDINECDQMEVCQFLSLLKQPPHLRKQENRKYQEVTREHWIKEVKSAKKQSVSSVFSNRTYSVYKCTLDSQRMTFILVTMLNIFLKRRCCPQRWLKLLETSLEKGKGPTLGKLRNITLIEGDMQIGM